MNPRPSNPCCQYQLKGSLPMPDLNTIRSWLAEDIGVLNKSHTLVVKNPIDLNKKKTAYSLDSINKSTKTRNCKDSFSLDRLALNTIQARTIL